MKKIYRITIIIIFSLIIGISSSIILFKYLNESDSLFICEECRKTDKSYFSVEKEFPTMLTDEYAKKLTGCFLLNVPYYDSKGKRHRHEYSYYSTNFNCSNGHKWELVYFFRCNSCSIWPSGYKKLIDGKFK